MNEDAWSHISTFLEASDICSLRWVFQKQNYGFYFIGLKHIIKTIYLATTRELLQKIKRPPQCVIKECTRNINIENISEFYCCKHDYHEIIEYCSSPWYYNV